MSYIDEMKAYYSGESTPKKRVKKVSTQPRIIKEIVYVQQPQRMYAQPSPVKRQVSFKPVKQKSYSQMLSDARAKDKYKEYIREKNRVRRESISKGLSSVAQSSGAFGSSVKGFVKSKTGSVKRLGLKGLFKKSIYD
jgi:hypothetical protein